MNPKHDQRPTFDDYFKAATGLALLVRRAFDQPKSVKRSEIRKALERFERVDYKAM